MAAKLTADTLHPETTLGLLLLVTVKYGSYT
jgi:hypothetical protein